MEKTADSLKAFKRFEAWLGSYRGVRNSNEYIFEGDNTQIQYLLQNNLSN